jgi:hypothetical protein
MDFSDAKAFDEEDRLKAELGCEEKSASLYQKCKNLVFG